MPIWIVVGVCAAVFLLCIAVAGARGAFDSGMGAREDDLPPAQRLPEAPTAEDLAGLRFTPVLWGYRPAEVDAALAALRERLAEYERAEAAGAAHRTARVPDPAHGAAAEAPAEASGADRPAHP
ncbi:DivIVA domain-containing protein [Brevibacterium salitolerans]|uniref:DivIVA domain-containing protein n=1 Tax=Brevibacterium salitolerans TaxID=1403566 RepID=A0ABP5HYA2_9MICO